MSWATEPGGSRHPQHPIFHQRLEEHCFLRWVGLVLLLQMVLLPVAKLVQCSSLGPDTDELNQESVLHMDGGRGKREKSTDVSHDAVEGCFNQFNIWADLPLPEVTGGFFLNNRRCQAACVEKGYALSATRSNASACLCGNDYPSIFHLVSDLQ